LLTGGQPAVLKNRRGWVVASSFSAGRPWADSNQKFLMNPIEILG
jgi:hypothetical protein